MGGSFPGRFSGASERACGSDWQGFSPPTLWQAHTDKQRKETFSVRLANLCESLGVEKQRLAEAGADLGAADVGDLLAAVRELLFAFACISNIRSQLWAKDLRTQSQKDRKAELARGLGQLVALADSGENSFPPGECGQSYLEAECRAELKRHMEGPKHRGSWGASPSAAAPAGSAAPSAAAPSAATPAVPAPSAPAPSGAAAAAPSAAAARGSLPEAAFWAAVAAKNGGAPPAHAAEQRPAAAAENGGAAPAAAGVPPAAAEVPAAQPVGQPAAAAEVPAAQPVEQAAAAAAASAPGVQAGGAEAAWSAGSACQQAACQRAAGGPLVRRCRPPAAPEGPQEATAVAPATTTLPGGQKLEDALGEMLGNPAAEEAAAAAASAAAAAEGAPDSDDGGPKKKCRREPAVARREELDVEEQRKDLDLAGATGPADAEKTTAASKAVAFESLIMCGGEPGKTALPTAAASRVAALAGKGAAPAVSKAAPRRAAALVPAAKRQRRAQ